MVLQSFAVTSSKTDFSNGLLSLRCMLTFELCKSVQGGLLTVAFERRESKIEIGRH
jgi:hypothetical protein